MRLVLTAHNSLTPTGFVWFVGATAALIAVPVISVLGTPVLWVLLPFVCVAVTAVWLALTRSWRDMSLSEELTIWDDRVRLVQRAPRRPPKDWQANPHWVEVRLTPVGGPVPNYLTLRGGGREVEVGAFLPEAERVALHGTLDRVIGMGRRPATP